MGYKVGYFSLSRSEFVEITKENLSHLPEELQILLNKWTNKAAEGMEEYDRHDHCPVKYASEVFRYEGVCYRIYPSFFNASEDYFEYLMIGYNGMEDELVEIGAEEVFCTAMID